MKKLEKQIESINRIIKTIESRYSEHFPRDQIIINSLKISIMLYYSLLQIRLKSFKTQVFPFIYLYIQFSLQDNKFFEFPCIINSRNNSKNTKSFAYHINHVFFQIWLAQSKYKTNTTLFLGFVLSKTIRSQHKSRGSPGDD